MDLFIPVTLVPLNTVVQSAPLVLSGLGPTAVAAIITSGNAVFVKNEIPSGTSTTVVDGDVLAIRILNSGTAYATAIHVLYILNGIRRTWSAVTVDDATALVYAPFTGVAPIDLTVYQDRTVFTANSESNKLQVYDAGGALLKTIPARLGTSAPTGTGASGTFLIAHYFSDYVLRVDAVTREVLSEIRVGARPYGVAYTATSVSDKTSMAWVTVSGSNKVVCLNGDVVVATYATGFRPLGIATTSDGNHVYIANNGSNSITHLARADDGSNTWASSTVSVGSKPFEIATDNRGNAWVTCSSSNTVCRVSRANTVTAYAVGSSPRGIVVDSSGTSIWIACSGSGTLVNLAVADGAVLSSTVVGTVPFAVAQGKDASIYVSCFGDKSIRRLKSGTLTTLVSGSAYPYALAVDASGLLWVAEYWSNTPSYSYVYDQIPLGFSLTDAVQTPRATLLRTNTVTVTGIDYATPVSVPDIHSATIIHNGVNVGRTTTVVSGDTISVALTTPNTYATPIEIPVFIGNTWEYFSSMTPERDETPDSFTFVDVNNVALDTSIVSNTVLVSGLEDGYVATVTTSAGTIRKDGISKGSSTTVTNGDRIAIVMRSSPSACKFVYATVRCGTYVTTWTILSVNDSYALWVKPEFRNKDVYDIGVGNAEAPELNSHNKVVRLGSEITSYSTYLAQAQEIPEEVAIYVGSHYENLIYGIAASGAVATVKTLPLEHYLYDQIRVSGPEGQTRNLGTVGGPDLHTLVDLDSGEYFDIEFPGTPYGISSTVDSTTLYVALSTGQVAVLDRDEDTGNYGLRKYLNVDFTTPGLRHTTVGSDGTLWVTDLSKDLIYKIQDETVVAVLSHKGDVWDMVLNASGLWAANSYDNTVSCIDPVTHEYLAVIPTSSVPSSLVFDSQGILYVGHYGSTSVLKIDTTTLTLTGTVVELESEVTGFRVDGSGTVWATCFNKDLDTLQDRVTNGTYMDPLVFADSTGILPNTAVRSSSATVSGLIRPTLLSIPPGPSTVLLVNGVQFAQEAMVYNGDVVELDTTSGPEFGISTTLTLRACGSISKWEYYSVPDVVPRLAYFDTLYGVALRTVVVSNTITIEDISPSTLIPISVVGQPLWTLTVNGVAYVGQATVKLGDVVGISGLNTGATYNDSRVYELQTQAVGQEGQVFARMEMRTRVLGAGLPKSKAAQNTLELNWLKRVSSHLEYTPVTAPKVLRKGVPALGPENNFVTQQPAPATTVSGMSPVVHRSGKLQLGPEMTTAIRVGTLRFSDAGSSGPVRNYYEPRLTSSTVDQPYRIGRTIRESGTGAEFTKLSKSVSIHVSEEQNFEVKIRRNFIDVGMEIVADSVRVRRKSLEVDNGSTFVSLQKLVRHVDGAYPFDKLHPSKALKVSGIAEYSTGVGKKLNAAEIPEYVRNERSAAVVADDRLDPNKIFEISAYAKKVSLSVPATRSIIHTTQASKFVETEWTAESNMLIMFSATLATRVVKDTRVSESKSYIKGRSSNLIEGPIENYIARPGHHLIDFAPEYIKTQGKNARTVEREYTSGAAKKLLECATQYLVRPRSHVTFASTPVVYSRTHVTVGLEQFKDYFVHNCIAQGTCAEQGAYATAEEARAAGYAAGHTTVTAVALGSTCFMWVIPADVLAKDCVNVAAVSKFPMPGKWYVHGG